jgi:hypothetical protein
MLVRVELRVVPADVHAIEDHPRPLRLSRTSASLGIGSVCAHFLRRLMLQHEALLQHVFETGETFATYMYSNCNICNLEIKHF